MFKAVAVFLLVLKGEVLMSFGTEMGEFLTSSNTFNADLIFGNKKKIPITFDTFELIYIEGSQFFIRLGFEGNPGSRNELTLEAKELKAGQTYPIRPQDTGIRATFAFGARIEYFPAEYSGFLTVDRLEYKDGHLALSMQFSIYFEPQGKGDMEVVCHALQITCALANHRATGKFVPKHRAQVKVPVFCEIDASVDGSYDPIDLGDVFFVIYSDSSYFIQCLPRHGGDRASLEFAGSVLKTFTDYPITAPGGAPESVDTLLIMRPEFSYGFSDPTGTFRVRRTEDSEEGFWFIAEFNFSLTARNADGREIEYKITSLRFQVQVSELRT
ncbi:hypothetical protein F6S08_08215 [Pseudomonas sp. JV449]|uniref:hypothetical protein n=1 Tax=Pseudomonas sp. JV449 TaxID=1890658 RepID=UPI0028E142DD|nr:hypothetical protein [Pseudomonas sp. JV449]MDT9631217.1 hypothetical protein [Pseudomonas sp. JV449]